MNKKKVFLILFLIIMFTSIILLKNIFQNEITWHAHNPLIGHALYGIDNNFYTNSYESLNFGYSKGIKIFETDFLLTSDNKLILNHHWENDEVLSYEEYMSHKIVGQYTPMDIKNLLLYMQEHKDIYIVVDTKQDYYDSTKFLDIYSKLVAEANNLDSKLLDRFIIQIYDYNDLRNIKQIYNFKDYIFTVYKLHEISVLKLISFCKFNNIDTIVFPQESIYYLDSLDIGFIKLCNLKLYAHTVNDEQTFIVLSDYGVDGIYTDSLSP